MSRGAQRDETILLQQMVDAIRESRGQPPLYATDRETYHVYPDPTASRDFLPSGMKRSRVYQ